MIAFIFPGQGAQYIGMGKDLYEKFPESRAIFDAADKILDFSLSRLCFEGPIEELTQTANCQPAIFTASIAAFRALSAIGYPSAVAKALAGCPPKLQRRRTLTLSATYMAGLSLGEYSALVAAQALSFEDGLFLVTNRANFMDEAAKQMPGRMSSILGLDLNAVEEVSRVTGVEIANLNCPGQVVISGSPESVDKANEFALKRGARRTINLEVSGAFHSSFMQPAAHRLAGIINDIEIKKPKVAVVSNVTGLPESSSGQIRNNLIKQMTHSVFWEESVRFMIGQGVNRFFEIGPGKVLKGLIRKIDSSVEVINVGNKEDIDKLSG